MKRILSAALLAAALCGCSSTTSARRATPSGFLKDYSSLQKSDSALLLYVKPGTDFSRYDKILLEPVQIYAAKEGQGLASVPREDRQRLVNYFDAALRENLSKDRTLVDRPGPGVLRLRVAVTEMKGAKVPLDVVSSLLPIGLAISEMRNLATGTHSFVGSAGMECEALDAATGDRVLAAVDERVGRKVTGKLDKFKKYRTPQDAFDHWAKWLRDELKGKPES